MENREEIDIVMCNVKECYDIKRILYTVLRFTMLLSVTVLLLMQLCVALPFMNADNLYALLTVGGITIALLIVFMLIKLIFNVKAAKESFLRLSGDSIVMVQKGAFNRTTQLNLKLKEIESVRYIRNLPGLIHKIVITFNADGMDGKMAEFFVCAQDAMVFVQAANRLLAGQKQKI